MLSDQYYACWTSATSRAAASWAESSRVIAHFGSNEIRLQKMLFHVQSNTSTKVWPQMSRNTLTVLQVMYHVRPCLQPFEHFWVWGTLHSTLEHRRPDTWETFQPSQRKHFNVHKWKSTFNKSCLLRTLIIIKFHFEAISSKWLPLKPS